MRDKAVFFAAALVIIFLLSAGLPAAVAEPASTYSVNVNRVVEISGWGLVTVNDTFAIRNNSTALLADVPIGLPRNLTTSLRYLAARDDQNKVLTIERDIESSAETYWFKVNFAGALAQGENYTFTVTSVFTDVFKQAPPEGFVCEFVTTPVLRVRGAYENMTIIAGAGSNFSFPPDSGLAQTSEGGRVQVKGNYAPIAAYTTKPLVLYMTSSAQFVVKVPHVSREIRFNGDGTIRVSETYDFENLANSISTVQLTLPQNSSDIMAYDLIGPLWDNPQEGPDISVGPRYSGGIETNRTFTFTVKYQVDPLTYTKQELWGIDTYKFALMSSVKYWVIDKLETTVIVPSGFNVRSVSPAPSSTSSSFFDRTLKYDLTEVTPYTDLELTIEYSYAPFWSGSLLLAWLAIVELVVVASVLVIRSRKPPELKIPVPSEKLKQFVELYDGRTALRLELDRMAEDLARGALNKHEYRRRRKTIELRTAELDRALQPLKQDLKTFHPRYAEMFLRMEKAEAEIDANRLGEEHFKAQYRAGKISKEAHDRALEDLSRRVDKAREIIETSLVTLREEAR